MKLPVIGQGTWQSDEDDEAAAIRALRAGIDAGMTHIDTAELYGRGNAEELVAKAIEGRRDEIFLVSKVMPSNASRAGTRKACERSLKHLHTDRIDLYLLHWPGDHPLEETLGSFRDLQREGKIRFFGLSNFDESGLAEAIDIAGLRQIACNQVLYHLEERTIERRLLPFCEKHDITVVGYSPFGSGISCPKRAKAGACLPTSPRRTAPRRGRWPSISWCAAQACSRFPSRRSKPTLSTMPRRAISISALPTLRASTKPSRSAAIVALLCSEQLMPPSARDGHASALSPLAPKRPRGRRATPLLMRRSCVALD